MARDLVKSPWYLLSPVVIFEPFGRWLEPQIGSPLNDSALVRGAFMLYWGAPAMT